MQHPCADRDFEQEPTVVPASPTNEQSSKDAKATAKRKYKKRNHFTPTLDDIVAHFALPLEEAAKKFGISPSKLKKTCRLYGITRWQYRKLASKSHSPSSALPKGPEPISKSQKMQTLKNLSPQVIPTHIAPLPHESQHVILPPHEEQKELFLTQDSTSYNLSAEDIDELSPNLDEFFVQDSLPVASPCSSSASPYPTPSSPNHMQAQQQNVQPPMQTVVKHIHIVHYHPHPMYPSYSGVMSTPLSGIPQPVGTPDASSSISMLPPLSSHIPDLSRPMTSSQPIAPNPSVYYYNDAANIANQDLISLITRAVQQQLQSAGMQTQMQPYTLLPQSSHFYVHSNPPL